tara:strand:+ start:2009 stop:2224 length:216 start_codon:yes stop_codon:yes gene_type:complete
MMFIFLLKNNHSDDGHIERREKLYSLAGMVAKLGLLFSEYAAHVKSDAGAITVASFVGAASIALVYWSIKA